MGKIKLPTIKELKIKIPDMEILEKIYFKGYRLKQTIDGLNKAIEKREDNIRELNKTSIMKQYRTHELMIKTIHNHINAKLKQFKKLFD